MAGDKRKQATRKHDVKVQDELRTRLEKTLNAFLREWEISYCQIYGVLEGMKMDIWKESCDDEDDDVEEHPERIETD